MLSEKRGVVRLRVWNTIEVERRSQRKTYQRPYSFYKIILTEGFYAKKFAVKAINKIVECGIQSWEFTWINNQSATRELHRVLLKRNDINTNICNSYSKIQTFLVSLLNRTMVWLFPLSSKWKFVNLLQWRNEIFGLRQQETQRLRF